MVKKTIGLMVVLAMASGCEVEQVTSMQSAGEHVAVEFTSAGFNEDVLKSSQVVLVDCWAPW